MLVNDIDEGVHQINGDRRSWYSKAIFDKAYKLNEEIVFTPSDFDIAFESDKKRTVISLSHEKVHDLADAIAGFLKTNGIEFEITREDKS